MNSSHHPESNFKSALRLKYISHFNVMWLDRCNSVDRQILRVGDHNYHVSRRVLKQWEQGCESFRNNFLNESLKYFKTALDLEFSAARQIINIILAIAVDENDIELAKLAFEHGASPDAKIEYLNGFLSCRILAKAIYEKKIEIIKLFLSQDASKFNECLGDISGDFLLKDDQVLMDELSCFYKAWMELLHENLVNAVLVSRVMMDNQSLPSDIVGVIQELMLHVYCIEQSNKQKVTIENYQKHTFFAIGKYEKMNELALPKLIQSFSG